VAEKALVQVKQGAVELLTPRMERPAAEALAAKLSRCLLFLRRRTSVECAGKSALCHQRTFEKRHRLPHATFAVLDVLERIASTLGVTVAQVALAWVRQQPRVTSTLIGARTRDQLETNLASIDVDLDDAVVAELNALTKPDLDYPWNVLPLGAGIQQGSCTINGVSAEPFVRQK
jgi:hypothetical protein